QSDDDLDELIVVIDDVSALVADRPRGVLEPYGGSVRPLELDVELADVALRLYPLQPDGPAGRVDVHRFDGRHRLLHLLERVEAEHLGERRVTGDELPVGCGPVQRDGNSTEEVS